MNNQKASQSSKLLIFASQGIEDSPYHQWITSDHFDIQIICDKKHADGYSAVLNTQSFENYRSNEPQVWAENYLKCNTVSAILSRAEIDVLRCAQLRKTFGIPGHLPKEMAAFRNKYLMKQMISKAGIATPRFAMVETKDQLYEFCDQVGFPTVVKPLDASGGVGVILLKETADIKNNWGTHIFPGLLAEAYIPYPMFHVDGLALGGKLVFSHVSKYFNSCLSWQKNESVGSIGLKQNHPLKQTLIEETEKVLKAMPLLEKLIFHCEFFIDTQNTPIFCEIAARTGGARIVTQIKAQTGINLDEVWAKWQCNLPVNIRPNVNEKQFGHLLIPPQMGRLKNPATLKNTPWIFEALDLSIKDHLYVGATKSGEYLQSYVVEGRDEQEIKSHFEVLTAHANSKAEWSFT